MVNISRLGSSSRSCTHSLSLGNARAHGSIDSTIKVYAQDDSDEKAIIETVDLDGEIDVEGELADGEGEPLSLVTGVPEDDMEVEGDEGGGGNEVEQRIIVRSTRRGTGRGGKRGSPTIVKKRMRIEEELEAEFGDEAWTGPAGEEELEVEEAEKEWLKIEKEWQKIEDHYQKIEREWSEIKKERKRMERDRTLLRKLKEEAGVPLTAADFPASATSTPTAASKTPPAATSTVTNEPIQENGQGNELVEPSSTVAPASMAGAASEEGTVAEESTAPSVSEGSTALEIQSHDESAPVPVETEHA
jgi:hypothetical protein